MREAIAPYDRFVRTEASRLREALAALGEVTGRSVDDDLLDRIFRKFCVGK